MRTYASSEFDSSDLEAVWTAYDELELDKITFRKEEWRTTINMVSDPANASNEAFEEC